MKSMLKNVNNVPLLFLYNESITSAMIKGCILFFHGLGSSKDNQYNDLYKFADKGFLAIGIDSWGHGDRKIPDFDSYFDINAPDFQLKYLKAIQSTANEVPPLISELIDNQLILSDKLGICGISMGAIIGYRVIIIEKRVSCAALFVGSPEWAIDLPESPHNHINSFYPTALLSLVASKDTIVSPIHTKRLHDKLLPYYSKSPNKLKLIEYDNSGHFMRDQDWIHGFQESIKWFENYL